jgi:hypothetical protein
MNGTRQTSLLEHVDAPGGARGCSSFRTDDFPQSCEQREARRRRLLLLGKEEQRCDATQIREKPTGGMGDTP